MDSDITHSNFQPHNSVFALAKEVSIVLQRNTILKVTYNIIFLTNWFQIIFCVNIFFLEDFSIQDYSESIWTTQKVVLEILKHTFKSFKIHIF